MSARARRDVLAGVGWVVAVLLLTWAGDLLWDGPTLGGLAVGTVGVVVLVTALCALRDDRDDWEWEL